MPLQEGWLAWPPGWSDIHHNIAWVFFFRLRERMAHELETFSFFMEMFEVDESHSGQNRIGKRKGRATGIFIGMVKIDGMLERN